MNKSIQLLASNITDLFQMKNNKTVGQTLSSIKYQRILKLMPSLNADVLNQKLGEYLGELKRDQNPLYLKFLNPYGDLNYCSFRIRDPSLESKRGVYQFLLDGSIMYVGRCNDAFGKRFNTGYGQISPKNCFIDGQSTNCRINSLVNDLFDRVDIVFHPIENSVLINATERQMIAELLPPWNIHKLKIQQ